jgi:hypothetical protein
LLKNAVKVKGTIIHLNDNSSEGDVRASWIPVAAYQETAGRQYECDLDLQFEENKVKVGAKVPIYFERGNPANAVQVRRIWDVNVHCVLSFLLVRLALSLLFGEHQIS